MAGYGSKINWHDGEGLILEDLRDAVGLLRRSFADEFLSHFAGSHMDAEQEVRPYRNALCARCEDFGIFMDAGPVLAGAYAENGLDESATEPQFFMGYWPGGSHEDVVIDAADSTKYRRDLIQYRLVSQDEAEVSRDFEDATTRAKTSQNVVARTNTVIEFGVKAGALQDTDDDADLLANEPDPDAGWSKLASVRVDAAATELDQDTVWDWRRPMGCGGNLVGVDQFTPMTGNWALSPTYHLPTLTQDTASSVVLAHPCHGGPFQASYGATHDDVWEDHRRVQFLLLRASTGGAVGSCVLRMVDLVSAGSTLFMDVADRVSALSTAQTSKLYGAADLPDILGSGSDAPLWSNGRRSPASCGLHVRFGGPTMLQLSLEGPDNVTARLHGASVKWWGGI